jgi:hypothetical protein
MPGKIVADHADVGSNVGRLFKYVVIDALQDKLFVACGNGPGMIDKAGAKWFCFHIVPG